VIKSRNKKRRGYVAGVGKKKNAHIIQQKGKDHFSFLGVDMRIILRWILYKYDMRMWTGFVRFRMRSSGGQVLTP
jgi:hypothetical protein